MTAFPHSAVAERFSIDRSNETLLETQNSGGQAGVQQGFMTMWSKSPTIIVGASCEYANAASGGLQAHSATSPYVAQRAYCAVNRSLYGGGAGCGKCFRVSYDGSPATDPGRPGSLVVQVVDSGSSKTFDCQVNAFQAISGAATGIFPVSYQPVDCNTAAGQGAVATVLDGNNAWYTKVIFSNLPRAVVGAELLVAGARVPMSRLSGATWTASPGGKTGAASFEVVLEGGVRIKLPGCFASWPVPTLATCSAPVLVME
eukprot:TRINITY_DN12440_c0_g1_i1.p1 TRINITY_DN12440_c0_g1~~TRINITY_DN12440_c0_g1_i1.p1  ORF type:complete len:290 (+),score=19.95 TRINITY_DN12440_c0_g1_i1:98-871(+)